MNGCSLKTEENLLAAKSILPANIMFETGNVTLVNMGDVNF